MNRSLFKPFALVWLIAFSFAIQSAEAQLTRTFTQPFESSDVAAAETGVLANIYVREGQWVSQGDVLGVLNIEVLVEAEKLAQLRTQSTARIESTQAILKLRQSKLENLDSLVEKGHANPFEIEQAKSQFESAQADYRLAVEEAEENKIELEKIRAQIAQRTIRSPIDGVVTKLHKQAGEYIAGNSPIFATVVQLKKLKANFYLDETTLGQLSKDQIVNVTVGLNATPAKGRIVYLSPIIDPQTGAGRVEIEIENQDGKLMSGVICQLNSAQSSTGNQPIPANVTSQRKRSNGVFPISNLPIRNNYR